MQFLRGVQNIAPETIRVGLRRVLVEYTAIDAAAEVFDKVAVKLRIDLADRPFRIDLDSGFERDCLRAENPWSANNRFRKTAPGND